MNTERRFSSFESQGLFSNEYRDRDSMDIDTWRDILDSDEIFWSDDDIEFLSSSNVQIVTIASDSDSADCKITAVNLNAFEDNQHWAEDEIDMDPDFIFPLKYKKCRTCNVNITYLLQCETCWSNKNKNSSRPQNRKPKRKKLLSKDTKLATMDSDDLNTDLCQLCFSNKKDGGFVHNTSCHFLCCYKCCKTVFEQNGRCPYCCRIIEKIIKIHC